MRVWCGTLDGSATDGFDVVVVGSGAMGRTAAITAADAGARVAVLEKADYLGGTSSVSGGMFWVTMNSRMAELGDTDDRDDALRYLRAVTAGRTADDVLL